MDNKKCLFISHESSRTGAPVVLLSLLRWLKKNTELSFEILTLIDGPLRKEFEALAKTYYIPDKYNFTLINKIKRRINPDKFEEYKLKEVVQRLGKNNYGFIFGNSIVTLPWLLRFKKLRGIKIICAVHELSFIINFFLKKEFLLQEVKKIDLILAGSYAVKKNLIEEFGAPEEKIKIAHAFIENDITISKSPCILKKELKIKDELIVGAMGSVFDLRKGIDLVIPLANVLKHTYPWVKFKLLWVGGKATDRMIKLIKQDVKKCELEDHIIFIDNTDYPNDYLNLFDIFVLLSREDPFPLVLLTAAYLQKPAIAFDKSGGAAELLTGGAGFIEPYLNIEAVAKTIAQLYSNRELIVKAGAKARQKVENEFSADVVPLKIFKFLEELKL